jgi:hypothetical protein
MTIEIELSLALLRHPQAVEEVNRRPWYTRASNDSTEMKPLEHAQRGL